MNGLKEIIIRAEHFDTMQQALLLDDKNYIIAEFICHPELLEFSICMN